MLTKQGGGSNIIITYLKSQCLLNYILKYTMLKAKKVIKDQLLILKHTDVAPSHINNSPGHLNIPIGLKYIQLANLKQKRINNNIG